SGAARPRGAAPIRKCRATGRSGGSGRGSRTSPPLDGPRPGPAVGAPQLRASAAPSAAAPEPQRDDFTYQPLLAHEVRRGHQYEFPAVVPVQAQLPRVAVDDQQLAHPDVAVESNLPVRVLAGALDFDQKIRPAHPVGRAINGPAVP